MGDESSPEQPAYIAPPMPKTGAQSAVESVGALKAIQPDLLEMSRLYGPEYAALALKLQRQVAPEQAQLSTDISRTQTPQWVDIAMSGLKLADPTGFSLSEELKKSALDSVTNAGRLTPQEDFSARNRVRSGLSRIGRGSGIADQFTEAQYLGDREYERKNQDLARALGIYQGTPTERNIGTGSVQSGTLPGVNPDMFPSPDVNSLMAVGQNADANTQNWFNNWNNYRTNDFEMKQRYKQPSKAAQLTQLGMSAVGTAAGAYFGGPMGAAAGNQAGSALGAGIGSMY